MADTKVTKAYVEVAVIPSVDSKVTKQYVEVAVKLPIPVRMVGSAVGAGILIGSPRGIEVEAFTVRPISGDSHVRGSVGASTIRGGSVGIEVDEVAAFGGDSELRVGAQVVAVEADRPVGKVTKVEDRFGDGTRAEKRTP